MPTEPFNGKIDGYDLMKTIQHWENAAEELQRQLSDVQQRLATAQRNAQGCRAAMELCKELVDEPNPVYGIHGHLSPGDVGHCKTQLEAAAEVARQTGGIVKLADLGKLLYDTGKWKAADHNSIKRSLHGQFNMSDDWQKEGERTGIYRLQTYTDESGGSKWPVDSSPTGDGDASPHTYRANGETEVAVGRIIA